MAHYSILLLVPTFLLRLLLVLPLLGLLDVHLGDFLVPIRPLTPSTLKFPAPPQSRFHFCCER